MFGLVLLVGLAAAVDGQQRTAALLDIEGPIGPATSDYLTRSLEKARDQGAALAILRMDTPGGLDTSMREIIRTIIASPIPIVTYVAPSGARAASAGTFISYAAHVAAMAPATNLGAATPVQIGAPGLPAPERKPDESEKKPKDGGEDAADEGAGGAGPMPGIAAKATNDAVAYIRGLAEMRGRNEDWAEQAVRKAASLTASDALEENVIDLVATDIADLLDQIDGREVKLETGTVTLDTEGLQVVAFEPDWRTRLLAIITNPNVAYVLMLIGIYGLIFEFYSPGLLGPGIIGIICLLLALYAFHVLPVSYAGLALTLLGLGLIVAETLTPSFGVFGIGGLAAFVIGSIMLIETDAPGFQVAWELVGSIAFVAGGLLLLVLTLFMRSRRQAVVSGTSEIVNTIGPVLDWQGHEGRIRVQGAIWRARSDGSMAPGDHARVVGMEGLTLIVKPDSKGS